jgi:hypothetical protein
MTCMIATSATAFLVTLAALAELSTSAVSQQERVEKTIVGDQVRSQGYACNNPVSAERIAAESNPDEPVYLLICETATYHVRLVPNQAAQVIKID